MNESEYAQCPYRREKHECINIFSKLSSARCSICMMGQNTDVIERQVESNKKIADAVFLVYHAIMDDKMNKMEDDVNEIRKNR